MIDTPAWLERYYEEHENEHVYPPSNKALRACIEEITRLNDRIAVLESGQREMETRPDEVAKLRDDLHRSGVLVRVEPD